MIGNQLLQILILFAVSVICAFGFMTALARNQRVLRAVWFIAMCGAVLFMAVKAFVLALNIVCDLIECLAGWLSTWHMDVENITN